jgi:hypothetical protein
MLRCAQSPRSNVLVKYASARRLFARLASEIFLSSLQIRVFQQLARFFVTDGSIGNHDRRPFVLSLVEAQGENFYIVYRTE